MFLPSILLAIVLVSPVSAIPLVGRATSPSVNLSLGTVVGTTNQSIDNFQGIPFALPPTGTRRLKPPAAITAPFGTFSATASPVACPQFFGNFDPTDVAISALALLVTSPLGQQLLNYQEDCLTLNVQRPAGTSATAKLPVGLYIYGGGFELGSTSMYNGSNVINHSVKQGQPMIFVAMNYRVGGFGFLAGSDLAAEGSTNLGLRDQRLAMQWVQDNIAAFGGDPEKVTIWGESAGSISVYDHTIINGGDNTYNGKPLFRAGIMNSGSVVPTDSVTGPLATTVYNAVVSNAGCAASTAAVRLSCLRALPFQQFLNAANSVSGIFSYRSLDLSYLPRPDPSDNFFSVSPEIALKNQAYAKIPIIIGDQEDQGTIFALSTNNITNNQQVIDYLSTYFTSNPNAKADVTTLVATYPDDFGISGSPYGTGLLYNPYPQFKRLASILGDLVFILSRRTYLASVSSVVPSWSYLSSYGQGTPLLGTYHGSEINVMFDQDTNSYATNALQSYFVAFIATMNPNTGVVGQIAWPQYTTTSGVKLLHFLKNSNEIIADTFRAAAARVLSNNNSGFRV